jgi:hypothetical protein
MSVRAALAAGLLVASLVPASAENVTATVSHWDAQNRVLTLNDQSKFDVPAKFVLPSELKPGSRVSIDFDASENGVDAITGVNVSE